ncbi:Aldo/keto reductase [Cadophora sp. DSE1049]|nr:Aldo/keto reductase [Cadophora sp. DSE1049]
MSLPKAKVIFGAAHIDTLEELDTVYTALRKHGVTTLDTAHLYGKSERTIGSTGGSKSFLVDTKAAGWTPGSLTATRIKEAMTQSLQDLELSQVNTYYLHAPDTDTPIEETLEAINSLYAEGKFKKFGISNYDVAGIERIVAIAKQNSWVAPTVYEGNYSPIARHLETEVLPTIRKYGMTFHAYSPLAGGFLVRSKEQLTGASLTGRFDQTTMAGQLYLGMYGKPSILAALEQWEEIANQAGVTKAALAYRWVAYHSALGDDDALVFGASSLKQMNETLGAYEEGPLSTEIVKKVEEIWELVKDEAPIDNFHRK